MQVEGLPAWPSGLRPHGARGAAPGGSVTGLAWLGPRRTGVLPQLLAAPREHWPCALSLPTPPALGPRRCQAPARGAPQGGSSVRVSVLLPGVEETQTRLQTEGREESQQLAGGRPAVSGCSLLLLRPAPRPSLRPCG